MCLLNLSSLIRHVRFELVILFVTSFNLCIAQDYENIIPPSPNAATLGEYGNVPISLTTGTPNINIPLYEIKGRQLSVPISISYRASGIKVEDQGSNIGIGWALNAGGVITRSIKGSAENGINQNGILPIRPDFLPYNETISDYSDISYIMDNSNVDTQPDLFFYNFGNYSGKFVFNRTGEAIIMPDARFRLVYGGSDATFVITDLDGVTYYFDDTDKSGSTITSWYLTKIVSADGSEEITFDYALETFAYWIPARVITYVDARLDLNENISAIRQDQKALRLTKINTNFGVSVDFKDGVVRQDYLQTASNNQAKAINEIEVDYDGNCIKKFNLDVEFIQTNWGFDPSDYLWDSFDMTWANYRMYLVGMKEMTCLEDEEREYKFEYWGRLDNGTDSLPSKMSFAQDHWGYYNGAFSNQSLRPAFSGLVPTESGSSVEKSILGADRSSSFPWVRCGTLKKITYPTGGSTSFSYEANYGEYPFHSKGNETVGGLRVSKISDIDNNGEILSSKTYEYTEGVLANYPDYSSRGNFFIFPDFSNDSFEHMLDLNSVGIPLFSLKQCPYGTESVRKVIISSGPVNYLGTTNGSHINYRSVKEISGDGYSLYVYNCASGRVGDYMDTYYNFDEPISKNNRTQVYGSTGGWDDADFRAVQSWNSGEGGWPYAPSTDYSWKRGLLLEQHVFREGNTEPIKSIVNNYDFYNLEPVYGLVWMTRSVCKEIKFYIFTFGNYKIQYGLTKLASQTITENGVTKNIYYEYDENYMLSKKTDISSEGVTIESVNKYPLSYTNSTLGSDLMRQRNIVSPIISSSIYKNQALVRKTETTFDAPYDDASTSDIEGPVVPVEIRNYPTGGEEFSTLLLNYYANGNISLVKKGNNASKIYLWDYYDQYPIAEVVSASLNQVAFSSFEDSDSKGGWTYDSDYLTPLSSECIDICGEICTEEVEEDTSCETQCEEGCNDSESCMNSCLGGCEGSIYASCMGDCTTDCVSKGQSKTGVRSFDGSTGALISKNSLSSGQYIVSFWAKPSSNNGIVVLDGVTTKVTSEDWEYFEMKTSSSVTSVSLNIDGCYIDELRLFPLGAQMTSYTYKPLVGITSISDPNGKTSYYSYDSFGRLQTIKDNDGNILQSYEYNYKQ